MRTVLLYEYAIVRVVPRPEREEFLNAGVILACAPARFLNARVVVDPARLAAFAPGLDLDLVQAHLEAIPRICAGGPAAGPIGRLSQRERFHWLTAPRSALIQTSAVHTGWCVDPAAALDVLVRRMVDAPTAATSPAG